jgi:hypothetical protein
VATVKADSAPVDRATRFTGRKQSRFQTRNDNPYRMLKAMLEQAKGVTEQKKEKIY